MEEKRKHRYIAVVWGMIILAGIAVLYGVCNCRLVVDFKNSCSGFLRYFQLLAVSGSLVSGVWPLFSLWWEDCSNNYPLEYKHRFRRVIERELEKSPGTAGYFDTWGSRCYLFNAETGNAWMLGKNSQIVYRNLELDMNTLKELGCDYIFSCGFIKPVLLRFDSH